MPWNDLVRLIGRQRWRLVGVALAVAVGAWGAVVLLSGPDDGGVGEDSFPSPPTVTDPVPAERPLRGAPADCGVVERTVQELVPGASTERQAPGASGGSCHWSSPDGERPSRDLNVSFVIHEEQPNHATAVARAVAAFGQKLREGWELTPRPVAGLGREAAAMYSGSPDDGGARVIFRMANAVVGVSYRVGDRSGDVPQIPRREGVGGAVEAAADIARSVGAPGSPRLTPPESADEPAAGPGPKPCDLLSGDDLGGLARGAEPERGFGGGTPFTVTRTCSWTARGDADEEPARERRLLVSVVTAPQEPVAAGTRILHRTYLGMHLNMRRGFGSSVTRTRAFSAVRGLGEEGFVAYEHSDDRGTGIAVFRDGATLVTVRYGGSIGDVEVPERLAVNGAYAAARSAASRHVEAAKGPRFTTEPPPAALPAAAALAPGKLVTRPQRHCAALTARVTGLFPALRAETGAADCSWRSAGWGTVVEVRTSVFGRAQSRLADPPTPSPVSQAIESFTRVHLALVADDTEISAVSGLGDQALLRTSSKGVDDRLVFRIGNTVTGVDLRAPSDDPSPRLRDALLTFGGLVADRIGGASRPAVRPLAKAGTPAERPADVCALVPAATADAAVPEAAKPEKRSGGSPSTEGAQRDSCVWKSDRRALNVEVTTYTRARSTGVARTWLARQDFLARQAGYRAAEPISRRGVRFFKALTGMGAPAFAAYAEGAVPATVAFQAGNQVVEVSLGPSDRPSARTLGQNESLLPAYKVARAVAQALRT